MSPWVLLVLIFANGQAGANDPNHRPVSTLSVPMANREACSRAETEVIANWGSRNDVGHVSAICLETGY
jgi:hypothetical protein